MRREEEKEGEGKENKVEKRWRGRTQKDDGRGGNNRLTQREKGERKGKEEQQRNRRVRGGRTRVQGTGV